MDMDMDGQTASGVEWLFCCKSYVPTYSGLAYIHSRHKSKSKSKSDWEAQHKSYEERRKEEREN